MSLNTVLVAPGAPPATGGGYACTRQQHLLDISTHSVIVTRAHMVRTQLCLPHICSVFAQHISR